MKRRLVGATVLISLAIIFLPMILEHEPLMVDRGEMTPIPKAPDEKFKSSLIRDELPKENPQAVSKEASPAAPEVVAQEPAPAPKPVEKPVQAKPGLSSWVIQVGSFSKQENAKKLVERLRKGGLDTMDLQPATVNGIQLYRVKVGPELDKRNAEKLLPKVKKVAGLQGTVIRYP